MERLVLFFIIIVGLLVLIALAYVIEKFSNSRPIRYFSRVGVLVLGIAAIMQALQIDPRDWLTPAPIDNSVIVQSIIADPLPTSPPSITDSQPTAAVIPFTPRPAGEQLYHASLRVAADSPDWQTGGDDDGESGYDDRGYFVAAKKGGQSYFVLSRLREYDDFAVEVNITPLTESRVTAFVVVVGWGDDGDAHLFVVAPEGHCGLAVPYGNELRGIVKDPICPKLERDSTSRVRLEMHEGSMRAIIDGRLIKEYTLDGYDEGFIGLGVLNYAPAGSAEEVKVRFDDLTVWALP
jgi:hypothetical protein